MFTGELISIGVAFSWTLTALCIEYASKRIGSLQVNLLRLGLAFVFTGGLVWFYTGHFIPPYADFDSWFWMSVSGLIGYLFGDFCLFYSYTVIGSRFGQLFMTLAPPTAALTGYLVLDERLSMLSGLGMLVTLCGIGISIFNRQGENGHLHIKLPLKGVLLGVGAGIGQGVGLVFSKLGMVYYSASVAAHGGMDEAMIPFAASQMRMPIAIIGFFIILMITKRLKSLPTVVHDHKSVVSILLGTTFGPFLGVAFSLMAVRYTESGIASTLMALTPIMILIPSALVFKQKVTMMEVLGAIVSVGGVALFFV